MFLGDEICCLVTLPNSLFITRSRFFQCGMGTRRFDIRKHLIKTKQHRAGLDRVALIDQYFVNQAVDSGRQFGDSARRNRAIEPGFPEIPAQFPRPKW